MYWLLYRYSETPNMTILSDLQNGLLETLLEAETSVGNVTLNLVCVKENTVRPANDGIWITISEDFCRKDGWLFKHIFYCEKNQSL